MRLQWLGQQQIALEKDHLYRGRAIIPNPLGGTCPPPGAVDLIRPLLLSIGGFRFPANLFIMTNEAAVRQVQPAWPSDRLQAPHSPSECLIWFQGSAIQSLQVDSSAVSAALAPVGGRLIDFWDETTDTELLPGFAQVPPIPVQTPPIAPIPPTPPIPSPPTVTPTTTKTEVKQTHPILILGTLAAVIAGLNAIFK